MDHRQLQQAGVYAVGKLFSFTFEISSCDNVTSQLMQSALSSVRNLKFKLFFFSSGLVLQTDENSNVRVKLEKWNDDPKQLWDFVPVGKKTTTEERISLLSRTTEI